MKTLPWHIIENADCASVDPELFFPTKEEGTSNVAKRICMQCPVRTECAEWALATGQKHGVWGGMTPNDRERIRRRLSA